MSELIPLSSKTLGTQTIPTVNARELHEFLGVKTQFNHWITRRIAVYGFLQDVDFCEAKNDHVINQQHTTGTGDTIEYYVSVPMAKELAMVERTAKGKEARQYFLECERRAQQSVMSFSSLHSLVAQVVQAMPAMAQAMQLTTTAVQSLSAQVQTQNIELTKLEQRVEQVEAAQDHTPGYMTIMGYARLRKFRLSLAEARQYGQELRTKARELKITLGKVPDERWGTVNSYPLDLLEELFAPILEVRELMKERE